jgi:hypothetical protein
MKHVEQLREQSKVLRKLAESFDHAGMRRQLIEMAAQCEEWAAAREQALREGLEPPVEA